MPRAARRPAGNGETYRIASRGERAPPESSAAVAFTSLLVDCGQFIRVAHYINDINQAAGIWLKLLTHTGIQYVVCFLLSHMLSLRLDKQ